MPNMPRRLKRQVGESAHLGRSCTCREQGGVKGDEEKMGEKSEVLTLDMFALLVRGLWVKNGKLRLGIMTKVSNSSSGDGQHGFSCYPTTISWLKLKDKLLLKLHQSVFRWLTIFPQGSTQSQFSILYWEMIRYPLPLLCLFSHFLCKISTIDFGVGWLRTM